MFAENEVDFDFTALEMTDSGNCGSGTQLILGVAFSFPVLSSYVKGIFVLQVLCNW